MKRVAIAIMLIFVSACATTVHDRGPVASTWRQRDAVPAAAPSIPEQLPVYVASFGLAPSVAQRYPELTTAQVGLGISNRIAEALYDSGRFIFVEEKAEMAQRISELIRGAAAAPDPPAGPMEVRWLLYGEVAELRVARHESVAGVRAKAEVEIRVTIQIRLLDRASRRYFPATATGSSVARLRDRDADYDEVAVGVATEQAVRLAAEQLLANLEETR